METVNYNYTLSVLLNKGETILNAWILHWHLIHFILHSSQMIATPAIDADYNPVSTLVSFSGGDGPLALSQPSIQITIIDDSNVELTETFDLTGVITIGGTLAQFVDNTATAQIIENDGMFTCTILM